MIITIIQVYCYSLISDTSYYICIIDIYRYKCYGILSSYVCICCNFLNYKNLRIVGLRENKRNIIFIEFFSINIYLSSL